MADPFSLSTGIVSLVAVALQLVVRTLGMVDRTIAAHQEAANQLGHLQEDLEDLQIQMTRIHGTLVVLASNTRDRGFRQLLGEYVLCCSLVPEERPNTLFSHYGEVAIDQLCTALDETFSALKRLMRQTKAEELVLHSTTLPTDTRTLEFVQAVLRHNLVPSTTTNLLGCLRDMRSDIEKCLRRLSNSFKHLWTLYIAMTNGLARVTTNGSILSTSTTLPARIKLVGWLQNREDIWKFFRRGKVATNVSFVILSFS